MTPRRNVLSLRSGYQRIIKARSTSFDLWDVLNVEVEAVEGKLNAKLVYD
jgi:hypothetical protein